MSDSKNHINKLTPELIEKYHNGTLSEEQQYQVERLMLNSSFDEEAMEGFESFEGDISADFEKLNSQLEKRIAEEKKDAPFLWIKIAASIVILALSSYLVWDLANDESVAPLAKNETLEKSSKESVSDDSVSSSEPKVDLKDTSLLAQSIEEETGEKEAAMEPVMTETKPTAIPKVAEETRRPEKVDLKAENEEETRSDDIEPELIAENDVLEEIIIEEEVANEQFARAEMKEIAEPTSLDALQGKAAGANISKKRKTEIRSTAAPSESKMADQSTNYGVIRGKVTSIDDNQPLPGINVVVKGTSVGTVTDIDGNFSINKIDSETTLVFSFIGLASEEIEVGNRSVVDINMSADVQQLSEVVVTAFSTDYESNESNEYEGAIPEEGMSNYKQYLKENINYPVDSTYETGKVVVTFDLNVDGSISNIKIKKSLGPWQDKEAIRLIQNGPKWNPANRGGTKIKSTVRGAVKFEEK